MVAALCVACMALSLLIPRVTLAITALAGIFPAVVVITCGCGWAAGASAVAAALGLLCALDGRPEPDFTGKTVIGALARHVMTPTPNFQPMNANFGILDPLPFRVRGKKNRYEKLSETAIETMNEVIQTYELR